jgi:hypothetical protein
MGEAIYVLCTLTALACAVLLHRGYRRSGERLLLWASICFVCLTMNNLLLYVDLVVIESVSLALPRSISALLGLSALLYGLVWEGGEA